MTETRNTAAAGNGTSLEGSFLIAMPGMSDKRFAKSVVYICAHSPNGAMGFVINKPQTMSFPTLLMQLEVIARPEDILMPEHGKNIVVTNGGPVESGRGFVLHSGDYKSVGTVVVDSNISLTPTMDILKALSKGTGPHSAMMVLGYAGWSAGQLESEIAANGWLTCPGDFDIVFSTRAEQKYSSALAKMGIDPAFLAAEAGHA
ncbi:YqgE/AlgH family protein [Aureimonas fodinaquatilis]|uniref:UPF0301 protein FPY71_05230 n=1 Tax=Aureimonas fodinaquatilis TaxID=2565783 RepID=A0A5B0E3H8_9HYPH|nr:YqgE/AlgH family protein [Aureimonas fodinaquatilis]KAA0972491.1 YqgE/AlgH family protein [Aureimonas fodinaquatilis]